jgi:hypothetical protein
LFEEVSQPVSRWKFFVWPDVSTSDGAQEAISFGYWCSFFVALVMPPGVTGGLAGVKPAWLVHAAVFAILGLGIWRKWRSAAAVAFLLHTVDLIVIVARGQRLLFLLLGIFLLFGFLGALRGTVAYWRLVRAEPVNEEGQQQTDDARSR